MVPFPRQWDVCGQDRPVSFRIVSGSKICTILGARGSVDTSIAALGIGAHTINLPVCHVANHTQSVENTAAKFQVRVTTLHRWWP